MTTNNSTSGVIFLQRVTNSKKRLSRAMRKEPTTAEELLWQRVRGNGIAGFKFRRQQVIEGFIVDFFCHQAKLVVELDGDVHDTKEQKLKDAQRRVVFEARGLAELRFRNKEIFENTDGVIAAITATVRGRLTKKLK